MIKKLLLPILLISISTTIAAQSKSEIRQYNSAISKGTIKAYQKFIDKHENSSLVKTIIFKRDSLIYNKLDSNDILSYESFVKSYPSSPFFSQAKDKIKEMNTSKISRNQAMQAMMDVFGGKLSDKSVSAIGLKYDNKEHVIGLVFDKTFSNAYKYDIVVLNDEFGTWKLARTDTQNLYFQRENQKEVTLDSSIEIVEIGSNRFIHFNYENIGGKFNYREFVTNLYDIRSASLFSAMFAGKEFKKLGIGRLAIEGELMDMGSGFKMIETEYLTKYILSSSFLVPISQDKLLADQAIEWWYSQNNKNKKTLSFGLLPNDNLIVKTFKQSDDMIISQNNNVALFDIRGNTVICAYNRKTKDYSLVWCEQIPKNRKTEALLNSIYFESSNSLVLYYYKGRTTYKVRINLANKRITY